jgi:hypothetical protein
MYQLMPTTLKNILRQVKCPHANAIHCAGNDAHFTLRAALLLAAQDYMPDADPNMLQLLRDVGRSYPVTLPKTEKEIRDSKKTKAWRQLQKR